MSVRAQDLKRVMALIGLLTLYQREQLRHELFLQRAFGPATSQPLAW